jgi:putative oxidoreductase
MRSIFDALLGWPDRIARHLTWLGPLAARFVLGWVFMWSGWAKFQFTPDMIERFTQWGIPFPQVMTPLVSGIEFVGGLFLILGFLTRISAGALGVVMIVAIKAVLWEDVDSLETLLGFDESAYLAVFLWLAIAGPGKVALDPWLQQRFARTAPITAAA